MATTKFIESGTDATGDLSFFTSTRLAVGTVATDTTQFKDGLRSVKTDVTAGTGAAEAQIAAVVVNAGARISCWLMFSTVAPSTDTAAITVYNSGYGSSVFGVGIDTNGHLAIEGVGTTRQHGSTALSANTWYRVTLSYVLTSASNWKAKAFLNGALEVTTDNTIGTLSGTSTDSLAFGASGSSVFGGGSAVMSIWIDSIYVDNGTTNDDPGNIHVTAKRPNANGSSVQFTTQIGAGGSGYGSGHSPQVNEQPLSTTNGWSIQNAAKQTEEYSIESTATGDMNITSMTLVDFVGWVYAKVGVNSTGNIIVANVATNISVTTAYTFFSKIAGSTIYPLGNTDIGMDTNTVNQLFSLAECGIVFAYIPPKGFQLNKLRPRIFAPGLAR